MFQESTQKKWRHGEGSEKGSEGSVRGSGGREKGREGSEEAVSSQYSTATS